MSLTEKLKIIAENTSEVYNAGKTIGMKATQGEAYTQGKEAEWNQLWDGLQDYGNRTDYSNEFRDNGWNITIFKPKYKLNLVKANNAFLGIDGIAEEYLDYLDFTGDKCVCGANGIATKGNKYRVLKRLDKNHI